jgi:hypothetical protein
MTLGEALLQMQAYGERAGRAEARAEALKLALVALRGAAETAYVHLDGDWNDEAKFLEAIKAANAVINACGGEQ